MVDIPITGGTLNREWLNGSITALPHVRLPAGAVLTSEDVSWIDASGRETLGDTIDAATGKPIRRIAIDPTRNVPVPSLVTQLRDALAEAENRYADLRGQIAAKDARIAELEAFVARHYTRVAGYEHVEPQPNPFRDFNPERRRVGG